MSKIAIPRDPCDHCAIIKEKPLPIPLVTIALFMTPIETIRIAVNTPLLTPNRHASQILLIFITLDCISREPMACPISQEIQEAAIRTPIAPEAA